jgi:hypothetical protein
MGYRFKITGGVRVKKAGHYPWPIKDQKYWNKGEDGSKRTIELDTNDVLTKSEDGTYMVHTGLGCFGIVLKDDEVDPIGKDVNLQML